MEKTIIYFPLEPYKERYTIQLSAKEGGWLTSRWRENNVPYVYIDGKPLSADKMIKNGSVLDASGRGFWACSQIMEFLKLYESGRFDHNNSVIYLEDFWHPGIEALAYMFHITGKRIPMYAMLHAQSVDIFDFTYPMRGWMRHFEKGIASILDGIFVTSTILRDLCVEHGLGDENKVFIAGLPYNSTAVKSQFFPEVLPLKKNQVVFSSRFDREKDPLFFLAVANKVKAVRPDISFVATTSASDIRSNDSYIEKMLNVTKNSGNVVEFRVNQTKEQYYKTLLESKVQFNCALQDFVSWTLLEALTCQCLPVYPYFRSFPEVLPAKFLYTQDNAEHAADLIIRNVDNFEDVTVNSPEIEVIIKTFDDSWKRMYDFMCNGFQTRPLFDKSRINIAD